MTVPTTPVEAVFFDVGGPIYNDDNFLRAAIVATDELRAEQGLDPADPVAVRAIYDRVRNRGGSLRGSLARELLGQEGLRGALHDRIREHWTHPEGTLYEDVLPLLSALHGTVPIGILANQERTVIEALERDGVAPFVDIWGVSAVVGYEKPDPRLFQWCLERAGTDATRAVHIGNRLDNDVRPASALGLRTVWVLRGEAPDDPSPHERAEADLVVPDLRPVEAFVRGSGR
ncbi:HAD family hydrolase [Microbacterium testaceum]|uniref:HAD family hydrolase n=1 Tax=Microbacterium testaceum TaxID=2033 RepID=UPI0022DEF1AC|nr:HAD family hydrolase [Microbacterium testaceum]